MSNHRNLLLVNSSARKNRSLSRQLGETFLESWKATNGSGKITIRDVGMNPPAAVTEEWIAAAFAEPTELTDEMQAILAESDAMIDEIIEADVIVLGAPMYNYSMPATLKAWFDLVARVGKTFSFDLARGDYPIEPILSGKTLVVLSSRGEFGFQKGGIREHMNALDPAISACAHYLGASAEEVHTIAIEYEEFKGDRWEQSVSQCQVAAAELAEKLAA